MYGKTHAVHGAIAGGAAGTLSGDPRFVAGGVALGALAALGPDVDHKSAPAGRLLPPVRWAVNALSRMCGLPTHRGITHVRMSAVVVGATALLLGVPWILALAVTAGWLAALYGDKPTKTGLPHFDWPLTEPKQIRHKRLRIRTGGPVERYVIYPLSVVVFVVELGWALVSLR